MTIHDVSLAWSKTGGQGASLNGQKLSISLSEGYQVTHSFDATVDEIMSASGLPQIGTRYPGTMIPCTRVSTPQKVGPVFSIVTVDYQAEVNMEPGDTIDSALNKHPLMQPAEIEWDSSISSEPVDEDFNGDPIATYNGEPMHGISKDIADTVLIVTKNFPMWNPKVINQYLMAVNSDTFATFEPGRVRLKSCPAKRVFDQQYGFYWRATARFEMRIPYNTTNAKAWYKRVLHQGFNVKIGSDIRRARTIVDGQPTGDEEVNPVSISTADGTRLAAGTHHWKEFQLYGSLPYAALGFDPVIN